MCQTQDCAANLETAQYTFVQSRNCAIHLSNLEIAWVQFANVMGYRGESVRADKQKRVENFQRWWCLERVRGALHRSGISPRLYPDRGEGSFSELANFPEAPWCMGLIIHAWHWRWWRSCKSLLRTSLTSIYDGNSKGSILHATEIALSRDWHAISGSWECAAQSWDCANS